MLKRTYGFVLAFLVGILLIGAFSVSAAAGESYFYVDCENGSDSSAGTSANTPFETLEAAYAAAEKSGASRAYIVLVNDYMITQSHTQTEHNTHFVITSGGYGRKLAFDKNLRYYLSGDTTFEDITIEYSGTLNCVAQYNSITFGDGVKTLRTDKAASGLYVVGGWQEPTNDNDATLDSHITVKSGSFLYVIGGSRQRASGSDGLHLEGTHYINIEGGDIVNVLGASARHNWSMNAVLTMSGGNVSSFCTGGDDSRRLNGSAEVYLTGGEIGVLNINNVVGDATVSLAGAKVGSVAISYFNTEIEQLATKAKSVKKLVYDATLYSDSWVSSLVGFDSVENNAVVYASNDGSGDGRTKSSPTTFEKAFEIAAGSNAVICLAGDVKLADFTEPAHTEKITVTGDGALLEIGGKYTLSGETSFEKIKVVSKTFDAKNGKLFTQSGADVKCDAVVGNADLSAGVFGRISVDGTVVISGAEVDGIVGTGDSVAIEIHSGSVSFVKSSETSVKNFNLTLSGGSVGKIEFANVSESLFYTLVGGSVGAYAVSGTNAQGTLVMDEKLYNKDMLGTAGDVFTSGGEKAFFIADGGNGSGASASSPSSSLLSAYKALQESGGTIVVCGKYTLSSSFNRGTNKNKVTFTSVYGGVDYSKTNAAELVLGANLTIGGETEFKNIVLRSTANYRSIYANTHKLVIGEGIESYADEASGTYLSIMGGAQSALVDKTTHIEINSGIWQRVRGGTSADGSKNSDITVIVNGGTVIENLTLGSSLSHSGKITAVINGGELRRGIYASTLTKAEQYFDCDVTLIINGGKIYGNVSLAKSKVGSYSGSFNVYVNGGSFEHITDIAGDGGIDGVVSSVYVTGDIDLNAEMTGTYSFTNPIRNNGADPWLFYCDGYYYYTATAGSAVGLAKTVNIGDMPYAEYITIFDPEDGHEYSKNLWSPEIHYYSDEEIGVGNGGWYLFLACDDGDNVHHRMYVLKCLDGDNLLGRWGDPVTGEVNVPRRVVAKDIENFDNLWAAGMSEIRIGGKLYMLYITEAGRGTPEMHQTINIVEMTNPWTIVGESKVICFSEYPWEMGGYSYNATTGKVYPRVVEGSTAVYGEDGSVYIIYSGSGYWTTEYCLAQLKYIGGDPLEITSWKKSPEPILYKSDSINGCGHASYVTDTDGQGWVCYHAYKGKDTASGRFAFVEPYHADKNGVVIADGSGHPAPIDTVYTVNVNPLPLGERIHSFDTDGTLYTLEATLRAISDMISSGIDNAKMLERVVK